LRETTFIRQKKKSWQKFEEMQRRQGSDPDELTRLFVEITDDLSYSRTFYAKRSVRVYLNYLAQLVFFKVNKNKKVKIKQFFSFWTTGLPMEFARSWKAMLFAVLIFFGAMTVGVVSTMNDIGYAEEIMGAQYIRMTEENIANGDPMAVYHQHGSAGESTFMLTQNNTRVAALTYTSGILAGLPPIIIMVKNGIMLGTFHYYLYSKDVLVDSMWVVWIHGVLEISAIVIAGGAGLVLGGGLIFPGTFTRLQSLRISAKRSFKIALSTLFILIISGFIEGSVTRFTQMPMGVKYLLVLGSLAFICFYFIAYPIYLYKTKIQTGKFVFEDKIPHNPTGRVELEKVREIGEMFNDSLNIFRQIFPTVAKCWLALSFPILIGLIVFHFGFATEFNKELLWWISITEFFTVNESIWINLSFFMALIIPLFLSAYYALQQYRNKCAFGLIEFYTFAVKGILKVWPLLLFLVLCILVAHPLLLVAFMVLCPFIFQFSYLGFYKKDTYKNSLNDGKKLVFKSWFGSVGFFMIQMTIPLLLMLAAYFLFGEQGMGITDFVVEFILEHISPFVNDIAPFANALNFGLYYIIFSIVLTFVIVGMAIQFHSVRERIEAHSLYNRLQDFGTKHNLFEQIDEGEY
jgi:uncharacterized membrane protein SpoIIM required for sporulation|tara:strand:- start:4878 stop:6770 length:1893 start_codon:yes stop_codon:yes gene_type:complete